jgi:hypothetical protein
MTEWTYFVTPLGVSLPRVRLAERFFGAAPQNDDTSDDFCDCLDLMGGLNLALDIILSWCYFKVPVNRNDDYSCKSLLDFFFLYLLLL